VTLNSTDSDRRRPWYRIHLGTFVVVAIVGAALTGSNFRKAGSYSVGGGTYLNTWNVYGWPTVVVNEHIDESIESFGLYNSNSIIRVKNIQYRWNWIGLSTNAIVSLILIVGVVLACENWARQQCRPWQFSIGTLLMLMAASSMTLTIATNNGAMPTWLVVDPLAGRILDDCRWYVVAPIFFGIGCLNYSICLFLQFLARQLLDAIPGHFTSNSRLGGRITL